MNSMSGSSNRDEQVAATTWRAGDECRIVNLRIGVELDGKIEVVRGHKMVVQTEDGQRWTADVDSSFVQARDLEPQPTDGPDYHADLAFWKEHHAV